ncbi:hypothetical protein MRX96_051539, partial [Rhipicephalus microplus]
GQDVYRNMVEARDLLKMPLLRDPGAPAPRTELPHSAGHSQSRPVSMVHHCPAILTG